MPSDDRPERNFPGDRAIDFIREFRSAVVPDYGSRASLNTSPPLFVLRVPETTYETGVQRIVDPLIDALRADSSRRVPYAHLASASDDDLLATEPGRN